ncbi:MAG TPA: glycosyltransferase family 4 protein [Fimbriimonas sp.]|nr:glycosyltransferase family 4 protein [Fimbriimonas sp.]
MSAARKRVFIISDTFHPEDKSTARILSDTAFELGRTFDVTALTLQPSVQREIGRQPDREEVRGVRIVRASGSRLNQKVFWQRIINSFLRAPSLGKLARTEVGRGDVAVVVTNPPQLPYLVSKAGKSRGFKTVLLVHDFYPEVLVGTGRASANHLVVRHWSKAARTLYHRVDRIIVQSESAKSHILRSYGVDPSKIVVIENYGEIDLIRPMPKAQSRFSRHQFTVQIAGNIGRGYEYKAILEAAKILEPEGDWHFEFVGNGSLLPDLQKGIEELRLSSVTVRDYAPRNEMSESLAACDVAFIGYSTAMSEAVPSRLYNVLASARPLIAMAAPHSELGRCTSESGIGWVVAPGDVEGLVKALRAAKADPDLAEKGRKARELAEARFSPRAFYDKFAEVLSKD